MCFGCIGCFLVAQAVKDSPTMWETWVRSLGWEDPLEESMATHFSIPAFGRFQDVNDNSHDTILEFQSERCLATQCDILHLNALLRKSLFT